MSDAAAPAPKKKGKLGKMLVMGVGVLVLVGGGVGAGLYAAGAGLVGDHGPKEDPNKPKLVLKEGEHADSGAPAVSKGHAKEGSEPDFDRSKYQATFFPIENTFTSNLRDSDGFVQLGIGVSTYYDERVIQNLEKSDMPVRSAVLMTLADQDAFAITTPEGKVELRKALKDAINAALTQSTGFGGIDDVYFTSFIIQ